MRVLQIHKFFFPHAGSETALFNTRSLLAENGHQVIDFAMAHPDNEPSPYERYFPPMRSYFDPSRSKVARMRDAAASVYSPAVWPRLTKLVRSTRPDVAHMHLIYHQLSLSVIDVLRREGVPMVMTLHDYKIGCPAYQLYRDGHPCELCLDHPVENVLRHRCIKGSTAASGLAAVEARLARTRGTYHHVNAYITPSRFAGDVAIRTGISDRKIHVIPNFLPTDEIPESRVRGETQPRFLFAGRLEAVKGVRELLEVYRGEPKGLGTLVIAGAKGELEREVVEAAAASSSIEYLGRLDRAEVMEQLKAARAMLLPSTWYENNPISLIEARAQGVPVICTDMGGLPEMVDDGLDGLVVPSGDVPALASAVRELASDPDRASAMGRAGRLRFDRENSPAAHYSGLMGAYAAAIADVKGNRHPGPI
jgi:glycosyltransferase involved in cell wall biosynthesis